MLLEAPQLLHSLMEAPIEDTHTALCLPPGEKMYNAMLVSCFALAHHIELAYAETVYARHAWPWVESWLVTSGQWAEGEQADAVSLLIGVI